MGNRISTDRYSLGVQREPAWRVYRVTRWFFRRLAKAYLRLDVRGVEWLPATGGVIVAGNHPNVLDGLLLLILSPRRVCFLVAEDLFFHRYLHGLFTAMGCIPVYRRTAHNGGALREAIAALQRGEVLGLFPEGTTSFRGSMEQVKHGVALLALKTGCPVVPFAIQGSAEAFPKGSWFPRPRLVRVRFASPVRYPVIVVDHIPEHQVTETLADIRQRILQAMRHLDEEAIRNSSVGLIKHLRIGIASLFVLPLASFLTLTANPSLDPFERR